MNALKGGQGAPLYQFKGGPNCKFSVPWFPRPWSG